MKHNFIPKPYLKQTISIRIDTAKLEEIDALAFKYDISRSTFINRCIELGMYVIAEQEVQP